jgi:hypothetical protein
VLALYLRYSCHTCYARCTPYTLPILATRAIDSAEAIRALVDDGQQRRAVGRTNMNEHSSRSHSVITLKLTSWDADDMERVTQARCMLIMDSPHLLSTQYYTYYRLSTTLTIDSVLHLLSTQSTLSTRTPGPHTPDPTHQTPHTGPHTPDPTHQTPHRTPHWTPGGKQAASDRPGGIRAPEEHRCGMG